jgi:cytoskeletal protein CcmA (bactofilin family)
LTKASDELKHSDAGSIPAGLHIQGQISGNEDLVVDGIVEGPIQLTGCTLTVGEKGKVTGDIAAREVVVQGTVAGNVQASERVEIKASGSIVGDIATARIIINDGAHFKGSIEIAAKEPPVIAPATKL